MVHTGKKQTHIIRKIYTLKLLLGPGTKGICTTNTTTIEGASSNLGSNHWNEANIISLVSSKMHTIMVFSCHKHYCNNDQHEFIHRISFIKNTSKQTNKLNKTASTLFRPNIDLLLNGTLLKSISYIVVTFQTTFEAVS